MEPREKLELPLKLAHCADAVTRDICAAGLFFVIPGTHALSGPVDFEMQLPEISLRFSSSGEIVRVQHEHGTTGVAVRFVDPRLEVLGEDKQDRAGERARTAREATTEPSATGMVEKDEGSTK